MRETVRKPLMLGLGFVCLALAVLGAFLPILQGWIFLLIALAIFARESETVRRWIRAARRRWPKFSDKVHKVSQHRHVPHSLRQAMHETDPHRGANEST
jgi:uncharacterized membrane protein YbaN (DUF454 family)